MKCGGSAVLAVWTDDIRASFVNEMRAESVRPVDVDKVGSAHVHVAQRRPRLRVSSGDVGSNRIHVDTIVLAEIVVNPEAPLVSILGCGKSEVHIAKRIQRAGNTSG